MRRFDSKIDTRDPVFLANAEHNRNLAQEFHARQKAARETRPARDMERLARQKKLFVRERLTQLLDPGTPF